MRPLAGGHFIKHRTRGVDVCALVGPLSAQLFWSHVGQGADDFVRLADGNGEVVRVARWYPLGQAEIQDLQAIVFRDVDVTRFQVAMNDSLRMRGFQSVGQLRAEAEDFFFGQGARLRVCNAARRR